jgi:serine/threonine-protein kinase RsbW
MTGLILIERDKEFGDCLSRILQTEGFEVSVIESSGQIPDMTDGVRPDAVILDLHDEESALPDTVEQLVCKLREIPVLILAHYQNPGIACKALGVGARDYLLKPFSTREILDRVRKITGTGGTDTVDRSINAMASGISYVSNLGDILQVCLDQLTSTLHLTDCLVALRDRDSFKVVAGKGYYPDPTGRKIELSPALWELLTMGTGDNLHLVTDGVREITSSLALNGHRPFPTLMPLEDTGCTGDGLRGFVMGHGGLVLEQEDLLEMERFLSQISHELASLTTGERNAVSRDIFKHQGELRIPESGQVEAVDQIIDEVSGYLRHESDLFWIRLSLDEAISNAIIHGHNEPMERPRRPVRVLYSVGPKKLVFTVEDTGEGFDCGTVPDPTADENLLNVNGRGIFLMRKVMDEVIYNDRGNRVTMVKRIDGRPLRPFPEFTDSF